MMGVLLLAAAVITNLVGLAEFRGNESRKDPFEMTLKVVYADNRHLNRILLTDGTNTMEFHAGEVRGVKDLQPGDAVRVRGVRIVNSKDVSDQNFCNGVEFVSSGPVYAVPVVSASEIVSGRMEDRFVEFRGRVADVFIDDLDPRFLFMVVESGGEAFYVALRCEKVDDGMIAGCLGTEIRAQGIVRAHRHGNRQFLGRLVTIVDPSFFEVTKAPDDLFAVPELGDVTDLGSTEIAALGRRRVVGTVLALLGGRGFLIRAENGQVIVIDGIFKSVPEVGTCVDVVGRVENDLYHLGFSRAVWRRSSHPPLPAAEPQVVEIRNLTRMRYSGYPTLPTGYHGQLLRLRGKVVSLPSEDSFDGMLRLQKGDCTVPADVGTIRGRLPTGLSIGCEVEATGVLVVDFGVWGERSPFPEIRGYRLVVRSGADVRILSFPPWWTAGRLWALVGILGAAFAVALIVIYLLRTVIRRRTVLLVRERAKKLKETLRVEERTRLAVELHDSLSQTLGGVSMQLDAAARVVEPESPKAKGMLSIASLSLDSCRKELRDCLWDLRSTALEEKTMDAAVRRALAQHIGEAKLDVRFNVPRQRFSDATAHAVIRIIRELAVNAVRHGGADEIRVAGALDVADRSVLAFSVSDNGRGFDPDQAPGLRQGHFGLSGIRDRIRGHNGTMSIVSAPGRGTKVKIKLEFLEGR